MDNLQKNMQGGTLNEIEDDKVGFIKYALLILYIYL